MTKTTRDLIVEGLYKLLFVGVITFGMVYSVRYAFPDGLAPKDVQKNVEIVDGKIEALKNCISTRLDFIKDVVIVDEGNIIRKWPHYLEHLTGYSSDDVLGTSVEFLVPIDKREDHLTAFSDFFARKIGDTSLVFCTIETKEGAVLPLKVINVLREHAGIRYVCSTVYDPQQLTICDQQEL